LDYTHPFMGDGFQVKYTIRKSEIIDVGLGVFAEEDIPKDTVIWRSTVGNSVKISRTLFRSLCDSELERSPLSKKLYNAIAMYSVYEHDEDCLCMILDNGRFVNHSVEPNSLFVDGVSVAARDIFSGEEITEDYASYEPYPWPEPWNHFPIEPDEARLEEYLKTHPENPCGDTHISRYKCYVDDTGDRGLGLFLGVDAREGDIIGEPDPNTSLYLSQEQWRTFTSSNQDDSPLSQGFYEACTTFGFYMGDCDCILVSFDNARFVNHSLDASIIDFETMNIFRWDMPAGTELIDDYTKYDRCPWAMFTWNSALDQNPF